MSNINPYIHDFTVDLRNGVTMERAKKPLSQGDAFANKIVVHVLKDGQTVPLDGVAVSASVIRYDGATVPLTGTVDEGAACIVLNDECYAVPGDLLVSVVLAVGEVKQTILRLMLNVETSQTDIIADGGVIGSFSQLLAEIENMRSATAAAISAAERAEAAADKAEGIAPGGGGTGTVTSVNGVEPDEEGNVQITIPEVPAWAMAATKPTYTAKEVGADPAGTAASKVSTHNADEDAHPAIRQLIPTKTSQLTNDSGYLTEHQDISHLLPRTELGAAVDVALAEAKESGAFDGEDGKDGKTPVAGVDYYTPEDKAEFTEYIASELAKRGQLKPEFASSKDECTDPGKLYVLPDGYIYAIMSREVTTEGGTIANYTNLVPTSTDTDGSIYNGVGYKEDVRLSSSGGVSSSAQEGSVLTGFIPFTRSDVLRLKGATWIDGTFPSGQAYYFNYYDSGKTFVWGLAASSHAAATGSLKTSVTYDADTGVTEASVDGLSSTVGAEKLNKIAYVRLCAYGNGNDLIVTVNEEITETTIPGGTEIVTELVNTGLAFVPADYEDRIIEAEEDIAELDDRVKAMESNSNASALSMMVYAPSPQLPADGSDTADFDATSIAADEIYAYIDALVDKYPQYLTKETLGKDASGTYDWNRYTASRRTYDAWVKPTHPAMYAWVSGSTVIYSVSVSPRIGDTMYTTAYIGTAYSTVTAVDTPNQTRTVNRLVFSRDKSKDVVPTLVYTQADYNPYRLGVYATWHNNVYNASRTRIGTIASIADGTLTDSNGNSYTRYPMGDRNSSFTKLPVLVIGSNEHGGNGNGDPAEPAIISARLIKDLCECRNADNPFLNILKSEYMIVFCPLINPWGYGKDNGYTNANVVNVDRNFDTPGWGNDSDTRHGEYGGSENETQYFMNTLYASGAKIALANHALGDRLNTETGEAVNAGMCSYMLGRNQSKYTAPLAEIAETMNVNYGLSFYDMGQAPGESYGKTRSYMDHIGVEGGAVEMTAIEGYLLHGGARHTAQVMQANYTLMLQFLQMLIVCQEG